MAGNLMLGACVVLGFLICWLGITWVVGRMADHERIKASADRDRRLRQVSPTPEPMADAYTGKPRAAGFAKERIRVS